MPTKAQLDNLKPIKKGERTSEEQKRFATAGGIASGKARREMKLIKDEILKRMGEEEWDKVINNMIRRAMETNDGFCTLRDSIGQKPVTEVKADLEAEVVIDAKMK